MKLKSVHAGSCQLNPPEMPAPSVRGNMLPLRSLSLQMETHTCPGLVLPIMEKAFKHPPIGIPQKPHSRNNDDDNSIGNSHVAAATQPHASSEPPGVWRCAKNSPTTSI